MSARGPNLNPGETGWEKFNRLWDDHGHGSARSWARAHAPMVAEAWVERKRSGATTEAPPTTPMFAYGMNMPADRVGIGTNPRGARLPDHRLEFSHFANVVPEAGASVFGVVWDCTEWDLRGLDALEGVDRLRPEAGLYRRELLPVEVDGEVVECVVYVMARRRPLSAPYPGYLGTMLRGYRDFGLPVEPFVAACEPWPGLIEVAP